jgi:hypothetical protein
LALWSAWLDELEPRVPQAASCSAPQRDNRTFPDKSDLGMPTADRRVE